MNSKGHWRPPPKLSKALAREVCRTMPETVPKTKPIKCLSIKSVHKRHGALGYKLSKRLAGCLTYIVNAVEDSDVFSGKEAKRQAMMRCLKAVGEGQAPFACGWLKICPLCRSRRTVGTVGRIMEMINHDEACYRA